MQSTLRSQRSKGFRRLYAALLPVLIGGVIGGVTALPTGRVLAHLDPWGQTWPYVFSDSSCRDEVDPISIVYYGNATTGNVDDHAAHHGNGDGHGVWDIHTGGTQYFYDHFCGPMDGQNANDGAAASRYHQRHWWNWDGSWGTYSLATPHWEDIVYPECGWELPRHAVRENGSAGMPEGGFRNAKLEIGVHWHNWNNGGGAHHWAGWQDWDNWRSFRQCDGQYAWGDGDVDFIHIP